jgi:hypothetical protein
MAGLVLRAMAACRSRRARAACRRLRQLDVTLLMVVLLCLRVVVDRHP